jgi:CBS domain-containing protein
MMLGGVSELKQDVRPEREAFMAFAGPLASFAIALVSYVAYRFIELPPGVSVALFVFAMTNLILGLFNLLPAFPMDGGRVLRGLLVKPLGPQKATRIATTIGKWMAFAFGLYGLFSFNVMLILIAVFIYMGASAERARLLARDTLSGISVESVMNDRMGEAHAGEHASDVARRLLRDHLTGARVVSDTPAGSETMGVVMALDLAERAAQGDADRPVETALRNDLPTVHADDDAAATLELLSQSRTGAVVVMSARDEIIGLVTQGDVQRALAIASLTRMVPAR